MKPPCLRFNRSIEALVGHGHGAEVLLPLVPARLGELGHGAHGRALGALAPRVAVDLQRAKRRKEEEAGFFCSSSLFPVLF